MNDKKKRRPGAAAQIAHSEKFLNSMQAASMDDVHLTMDQLIERKMRQEIVDKQKAALQGKAFQKEMTKAKRGTYRGGAIDMGAVNSIKFDN